jgi:hypothetical protein
MFFGGYSSYSRRLLRGGQEYADRGVVPQAISTVFQLIEQVGPTP